MKIVKALIPSAALLFFVGCGSVDHDPPELKVNDLGTVSPFDTLKVSFDKNVESFDDSTVDASSPVTVLKVKGKTIYVAGASDTIAGLPVFDAGVVNDSITFKDIEDEDGNRSKAQTVKYSTYSILDNDGESGDACVDNGTPKNAEALADSAKFFNGAKLEKGLTFAAFLSGDYNADCPDNYDYFRVYLRAYDTLFIQMTGNKVPLSVFVKGPKALDSTAQTYQEVYEFAATGKHPSVDTALYISADLHGYGTNSLKEYLAYYIEVAYPSQAVTNPAPYLLTVKRSSKK